MWNIQDILVDACAMFLIRRPTDFDVIATENMFGDILSDEASDAHRLVGHAPLGLAGKLASRGLFEPIHGSAHPTSPAKVSPTHWLPSSAPPCCCETAWGWMLRPPPSKQPWNGC